MKPISISDVVVCYQIATAAGRNVANCSQEREIATEIGRNVANDRLERKIATEIVENVANADRPLSAVSTVTTICPRQPLPTTTVRDQ